MATKQKRTPGLIKLGEIWHIDKWVRGRRFCESTGTDHIQEAEAYLARRLEEIRQAEVYGIRPKRTFRQAATKYLNECRKASIADDAKWLKLLDRYVGYPLSSTSPNILCSARLPHDMRGVIPPRNRRR